MESSFTMRRYSLALCYDLLLGHYLCLVRIYCMLSLYLLSYKITFHSLLHYVCFGDQAMYQGTEFPLKKFVITRLELLVLILTSR